MFVEGDSVYTMGALPEGLDIKTGDLITLNYEEVEYLKQPFGTRSESVTPFLIFGKEQLNYLRQVILGLTPLEWNPMFLKLR